MVWFRPVLPALQIGKERLFFPACPRECFSKLEDPLFDPITDPVQKVPDLLFIGRGVYQFSGADDPVAEVVEIYCKPT